jgi:hypothetical protein
LSVGQRVKDFLLIVLVAFLRGFPTLGHRIGEWLSELFTATQRVRVEPT